MAFDAPTTFTQAFWAKVDADGGERELVFKNGNYIVRVSNSNLIFIWFDGSLLRGFLIPAPVFGEWHHYAWTVVGNTPAKLYVDGVDQGLSVTFFGGAPFDGALAQFGLWHEELTGTHIAALQTQKPDAVNVAARLRLDDACAHARARVIKTFSPRRPRRASGVGYSRRSVIPGSRRAARRAGKRLAAVAVARRRRMTVVSVSGSSASTPKS
jgi:hypothetical protein